jgi:hypothetical protein
MPGLLLRLVVMALGRADVGEVVAVAAYRAATAGLCIVLGGLFLFAATACASVGAWLFLAPMVGPPGASAIVAGALLVVALTLLVTARSAVRRKSAPPPPTVATTGSLALQEVTELFGAHKETMLLAAVIAGIITGAAQRRQ